MFWGVGGNDPRIMRARLDRNSITAILKYSDLKLADDGNVTRYRDGYPIAMAIDYQLSRLYWVDHNWNSLFSMELDGRSVCVCVREREREREREHCKFRVFDKACFIIFQCLTECTTLSFILLLLLLSIYWYTYFAAILYM